MDYFQSLHTSNIIVHVTAGSVALLVGVVALITQKGGKNHRKSGNIFLLLLAPVIISGLLGVFVFGRNTFLLVITLLSGYNGFSGYRVLQTKSNQPKWIDLSAAILCLMSVFYFLYYLKTIGIMWLPVIIYLKPYKLKVL